MRLVLSAVLAASVATFVAAPVRSATFVLDKPDCVDFSVSGSAGSYTVACAVSAVPVCQLRAVPANPVAGSTVTLVAACSGSPFGWIFTGTSTSCGTTSPTCTDTVGTAGPRTYTVLGGNGAGRGPVASLTVTWQ
jgi:hypothetical protein